MNDVKFTQKIKQWFDSEHTDENIREGAMLLLQINNNRHLYQQIMLRPQRMLEHLKYELQKHYDYRIKGLSLDEVRKFDGEVTPLLQKAVDSTADADKLAADVAPHLPFVDAENTDSIDATAIIAKGKRADHEQLPDEIKEIWDANIQRWKRIKELFEACKAYQLSCDRFEGLNAANEEFQKMLLTLKTEYYAYKQSMDQYDHAVPGQKEENAETKTEVVISANAIGNARSYITKNIDKLIQLKADGKTEQAEKLQANIEQRVKTLLDAKAEIKPATLDKIKEAGIVIPAEGEDESIAEEKPDESQADQTGTETAPAE
jgi:hypothetical protein